MEQQKAVRRIDELGRIVLPAEVRAIMDWRETTAIEVRVNEQAGEVVLKTHVDACYYCGATENLKEFHRSHICPACQSAIAKL